MAGAPTAEVFAMVVARRPVSGQRKGGTSNYQANMQAEASARFGTVTPMYGGDLYARIVWFCTGPAGDVDNIIKPIADALKGVINQDDASLVKCAAEKVDQTRAYTISDEYAPATASYVELLTLLAGGNPHVLYIEVGRVATRRVVFGPVDGA